MFPGPSPGGDGVPAAASAGEGTGGVEEEGDCFGRPRGSSSETQVRWQHGEVQAGLEVACRDGVGPVADLDAETVPTGASTW
jgi:hypothetical protein